MNLIRPRLPLVLLAGLGLLCAAACSGADDSATPSTAVEAAASVGAAASGGTGGELTQLGAAFDPASPGGVLIRAAQTTEAQSFRYEMDFGLSGLADMPGVSLNFSASGEADAENGRVRFTMDLSPLVAILGVSGLTPAEQAEMDQFLGDGSVEMIVSTDRLYMRWPLISTLFGANTPWVSLDQAELFGDDMVPPTTASFGYDPSMTLAFLESLADVEELGNEDVRGVATTHYRGVITWDTVLEQLPPEERALLESDLQAAGTPEIPFSTMPIDVWVDADNLVRRYSMTMDLAQMATGMGEPATDAGGVFTFSYELFDFGEPIIVQLPLDADVTPLTEELLFGEPLATY